MHERKQKAEISCPNLGSIEFKDSNEGELLKEFQVQYEKGNVSDVHEFAKMLKVAGYEKAFNHVVTKNLAFDKMLEFLQEDAMRSQVYEDPKISLARYVDDK